MHETSTVARIKHQQAQWADGHGIRIDGRGYVSKLTDNLSEPMNVEAQAEFGRGAGNELAHKMQALHSSSALVCNFFHYWRYRDVGTIARACGLTGEYAGLGFEKTHSKPPEIGGIPPHLDVEIGSSVRPAAVEAKFTEPYRRTTQPKKLKEIYAHSTAPWGNLSRCASMARAIVEGNVAFYHLDAPQLLKHIVGLTNDCGEGGFTLIYLWYEQDCEEEVEHKRELERFKVDLDSSLDFRSMTYQDVFKALGSRVKGHALYMAYMKNRYFADQQ